MKKITIIVFMTLTVLQMQAQQTAGPEDVLYTGLCRKEQMQEDGIVRLSKIEVYPEFLETYMEYATEVGATSLKTEPGVLTMYAVADRGNPCNITILETYSSQEAYKKHIASGHFQKYKQGTMHMVRTLVLDDVTPLNPASSLVSVIHEQHPEI